jgi:hypothetical protein
MDNKPLAEWTPEELRAAVQRAWSGPDPVPVSPTEAHLPAYELPVQPDRYPPTTE